MTGFCLRGFGDRGELVFLLALVSVPRNTMEEYSLAKLANLDWKGARVFSFMADKGRARSRPRIGRVRGTCTRDRDANSLDAVRAKLRIREIRSRVANHWKSG